MNLLACEIQNWSITNIGRFSLATLNNTNIHRYEATWPYINKQMLEINNLLASMGGHITISNLVQLTILDAATSIKALIEKWLLEFFNVDIKDDHKKIKELEFIVDLSKLRNFNKHPNPNWDKDSFYTMSPLHEEWYEIHEYNDRVVIFNPIIIFKYTGTVINGANTNEVTSFIWKDLLSETISMLNEFFNDAKSIINEFIKKREEK